ncbi:MAG: hypothetical protein KDK91_03150 [Gammaproteobacteria bacterium]|nr:hypothetical protein [Gammaproteobacteria bacterium]
MRQAKMTNPTVAAILPTLRCVLILLLALLSGHAQAQRQGLGLCSVVKMEILQELALERIGFLATLEVGNNEIDASLTDFSAELNFSYLDPATGEVVDASDRFFVQPPTLNGISSIDGGGIIKPGETAVVEWFIIPKISAGGTTPEGLRYSVGANLAGSLLGSPLDPEVLSVIPDTITVKPEPQLGIIYFQPQDVTADDPFTPEVEAPIPFTLGVLIQNDGYGPARKVRIKSEQPRIVENAQGLLLVPKLLGSRIDDEPTDRSSLTVEFGDIEPGRCRKGAWDMITTLSGEFQEFKASYTHASELGGRDTSVITSVDAHFIAAEVVNDLPGRDTLKDFLADTDRDVDRIPDTLYESDCNVVPVNHLASATLTSYAGYQAVIRAQIDAENFSYIRLDDPGQAKLDIQSIVRSDGKVLNPNNYWTNIRYDIDNGNKKLTFLNIFDFAGIGQYDYTVSYEPPTEDTTPPQTELAFFGPSAESGGKTYITADTEMFFLAEDDNPVSIQYAIDGEPYKPGLPFKIDDPGEYQVSYFSTDSFGNAETPRQATLVLSADGPMVGVGVDTDEIYASGGSLSVRPKSTQASFSGNGISGTLDARAEVYRGAFGFPTLTGVPSSPWPDSSAMIEVGGRNVDFYQYRVDGGAWSSEMPVSEPIQLSGLSGTTQLEVIGRSNRDGYRPDLQRVSASWENAPTDIKLLASSETPLTAGSIVFNVLGATHYCFAFGNSGYRPESAPGAPISLSGLADGDHQLMVQSRADENEPCPFPADADPTVASFSIDRGWGLELPTERRVRQAQLGAVVTSGADFAWDGRTDGGTVAPPDWYSVLVTMTDALGRSGADLALVRVGDIIGAGTELASSPAEQRNPDARGKLVVWQDQQAGNWDVYLLDRSSGAAPVLVSQTPLNQERPRTDGRVLVWQDRRPDGNWDVWAFEPESGSPAFAITATPGADETRPDVDWPWVVYERKNTTVANAPIQLEAYNLVTAERRLLDPTNDDQREPSISGTWVAYTDYRDVGPGEIYLHALDTDTSIRVTHDPNGQLQPGIDGDWLVWADNRNVQLDLYGYDLARGVVQRLTDTPFDESRPSVNGDWVVYLDDANGEERPNISILHLPSNASLQLTNSESNKQLPSLADGELVWSDSFESEPARILSAMIPDLQAVFDNANTVAVTTGVAGFQGSAFELLAHWNGSGDIVSSVRRYTSLLPQPVAETATWDGNAASGVDFALQPGQFLWVEFNTATVLDLGRSSCDSVDLPIGTSAFSYNCFPDGYSAEQFVRDLGSSRVRGVRILQADRGVWSAVNVLGGEIVGEDFRIPRVAVVLVDLSEAVPAFRPQGGQ